MPSVASAIMIMSSAFILLAGCTAASADPIEPGVSGTPRIEATVVTIEPTHTATPVVRQADALEPTPTPAPTATSTPVIAPTATPATAVPTPVRVTPTPTMAQPTPVPPPVLSGSIVAISGEFDPTSSRLGALDCGFKFAGDPNDRWCFNAFGSNVIEGKTGVSFDYKVTAGADVFAVTEGVVVEMGAEKNLQYPGEFEIRTQQPGSGYLVIYDHVRDPTVEVGSQVVPAQRLGIEGVHLTDPSRWGRIELQINYYVDPANRRQTVIVCPQPLGDDSFRLANEAALAAHNQANGPFAAASVCLQDEIVPGGAASPTS